MELYRAAVCKKCWSTLRRSTTAFSRLSSLGQKQHQQSRRSTLTTQCITSRAIARDTTSVMSFQSRRRPSPDTQTFHISRSAATQTTRNLAAIHARLHDLATTVLKPEDRQLPAEQRILYVFEQLEAIASDLLTNNPSPITAQDTVRAKSETTAISALLGSVNAVRESSHLTEKNLVAQISEYAETIMRNPNVFITSATLKSYVQLQTKLDQPSSFPDIFNLYAMKPVPTLKGRDMSAGISYTDVSPRKVSAAIESSVADAALTAAIKINDLPLAIDIIHSSFCAPAFKRSKILRQALIPISGLAVAPVAAYTLSSSFSTWQNTMSSDYATGLAFAGIMTYITAVGTMGYITVTTANDQMDRVTWAQGVPLWERWIREEERAAVDRVAGAWGFQDVERRGDEDGEEWQGLKEFVGLNGMVLDRVELMDGME